MTDRELLEKAARAAGMESRGFVPPSARKDGWTGLYVGDGNSGAYEQWNPLESDGDALRLAVKLELTMHVGPLGVRVGCWDKRLADEPTGTDPYAATRMAIVRAAASMGE